MSRWPERWVRLAAALLPTHVRERYREEWLADLDGARELGIPTSSIAVGALLFTATIDRSAPEISGVPLSIAARIHARRGIALILSAGVLALGGYFSGARVSVGYPSATETAVSLLTGITPVLAILAAIAGLIELWRAAFFASVLAKICAALATVGVVSTPLAVIGGWFLVPLAIMSLSAAAVVGVIVWAGSSQPIQSPASSSPALSPKPSRRRPPRWVLIPALIVGGLVTTVLVIFFPAVLVLIAAAIAATVLAVRAINTRSAGRRSRAGSLSVGVMALAVLASVGVGALDLLVLSPEWMAPGFTVTEIYAALSPGDLSSGLVMIYIWIVFWAMVALVFLAIALLSIGGTRPSTHWMLTAGFAIIAAMVFFQFWAGFSLGNSISDTLPPFHGGSHEVGLLYAIVGQFSLVAALWGAIAPRRGGALRRAQGTETGPQGTETGPQRTGMGPRGTEPRTSGPETSPAGATYSQ